MAGFLTLTSSNGGTDVMDDAMKYLQRMSVVAQRQALVAGAKAYLATCRSQAMSSAPSADNGVFATAKGYRMAAHVAKGGGVTGYLYSAAPGNVIEAGFAGHLAPVSSTVDKNGSVTPGLLAWFGVNLPSVLAARNGKLPKAIRIKTTAGKPWVIPASDRADSAATQAFIDAVIDEFSKVV